MSRSQMLREQKVGVVGSMLFEATNETDKIHGFPIVFKWFSNGFPMVHGGSFKKFAIFGNDRGVAKAEGRSRGHPINNIPKPIQDSSKPTKQTHPTKPSVATCPWVKKYLRPQQKKLSTTTKSTSSTTKGYPRAPSVPSKKVRSWSVFRRLSTFLEAIWSPRGYLT